MIKKPGDLTTGQRTTIAVLARLNSPLYGAYLMKEQLREIFKTGAAGGGKGLLARPDQLVLPQPHPRVRQTRRHPAPLPDLIWNTLETGTTSDLASHRTSCW